MLRALRVVANFTAEPTEKVLILKQALDRLHPIVMFNFSRAPALRKELRAKEGRLSN